MVSAVLTWDLVIATYKREEILPRCLRLAAAQTRPPRSIIVIDSSPNWDATRELVLREIAPQFPGIEWVYEKATKASSAAQRNEGMRRAGADILFIIDDDSLMYPDCAGVVMDLYERDAEKKVAGVSMILVDMTPEDAARPGAVAPKVEAPASKDGSWLRHAVRGVLRADDLFVPYDADWPNHAIPASLDPAKVGSRPTLTGNRMSYRRELAVREPFEEMLARYAAGEDSDQSYRVSRHGALVTAFEAKIFHVGSPGGRLPPRVTTSLGAMNPLILTRLHCTDPASKRRETSRLLRRRLMIEGAKDLAARDFSMPRARGIWDALRNIGRVYAMSEGELREWYPKFQRDLIERYAPKG